MLQICSIWYQWNGTNINILHSQFVKDVLLPRISDKQLCIIRNYCSSYYDMYCILFQSKGDCYCANSDYDYFGKSATCSSPCPGDSSQVCGSDKQISVHTTGTGRLEKVCCLTVHCLYYILYMTKS